MERIFLVLTVVLVAIQPNPTVSLKLEVSPNPSFPGQEVVVSCFDEEILKEVAVTFAGELKVKWPTLSVSPPDNDNPTTMLCFPQTDDKVAKRFGLLQRCGNVSGIQVRLRPRYRGLEGNVECKAMRNSTGESVTETARLGFKWDSALNMSGSTSAELGSPLNFSCGYKIGSKGEKMRPKGITSWKKRTTERIDDFGIRSAKVFFSKTATSADNGTTVTCGIGEQSETLQVTVTDLSVPVLLTGLDKPMKVSERGEFACGLVSGKTAIAAIIMTNVSYKASSLSFARKNIEFFNLTVDVFRSSSKQNWQLTANLPRGSQLKPLTGGQGRQPFALTPLPRHNGARVTCEVISTLGRRNATQGYLSVIWEPSVQKLRLQNASGSPVAWILENKTVVINCSYQLGNPAKPQHVSITGEIKGAVFRKMKCKKQCDWKDQDGYQWRSQLWNATFRRYHNGKVIECKLADKRANMTLNVTYPPRIDHLSPAYTPVLVGTIISCSSKANPPAVVSLLFRPQLLKALLTGTGRVASSVPMGAAAGEYNLQCLAKNLFGDATINRTLFVTKRPLQLDLTLGPLQVDSGGNLSCSSRDADLEFLQLRIPSLNINVTKNLSLPSSERVIVQSLPSQPGVKVLMKPKQKEIAVWLLPQPNNNGMEVICFGRSTRAAGKSGEERSVLAVTWAPSVRRVALNGSSGRRPNVAVEEEQAVVTCEVQGGSERRAEVRAKIDGKELRNPSRQSLVKIDSNGFRWTQVTWRTSLTRQDDGTDLQCWVANSTAQTKVSVLWKPNATLTIDESVLSVNCSSSGNPTPSVNLTMLDDELMPVTEAAGLGSAKLDLSKYVGNFSFLCVANNSVDEDMQESSWWRVEPADGAKEENPLMLLILVALSLTGLLILLIVVYNVMKGYSHKCSSTPDIVEVHEPGTEEVLLDTRKTRS